MQSGIEIPGQGLAPITWQVTWKDETASTNDDVRALAEAGAAEGTCVAAVRQVSGRGQWDRAWESPRGGLYFSFLLRPGMPQDRWPRLSPAVAQSVASVVREQTGATPDEVWVKEPNDVVCAAGKLCGILLESRDGAVVVGVGVNVFHPERPVVTDGRNVPAFLEDLVPEGWPLGSGSRDEYLEALHRRLLDEIGCTLEILYTAR